MITFPFSSFLLIVLVLVNPLIAATPTSISVRLVTPSPSVCMGQPSVKLEAVLTNTESRPLTITRDGVGYGMELAKWDSGRQIDRRHIVREIAPDSWEVLSQNQSIIVEFVEPLSSKFFASPGLYEMQIRFGMYARNEDGGSQFVGAVSSNKVMFQVLDCEQTRVGQEHPVK